MPDPNGLLLPAERQAIAGNMQTKVKPPACPWCGSSNWELGPFIAVSSPLRANASVVTGGPAIPLVMLMSPCGYVAHFAAKMFGVDIRPPADAQAAPAEQA
jgi:hypothetical protein